jgi:hypothetical protein
MARRQDVMLKHLQEHRGTKKFYTKCCGADILHKTNTGKDYCAKCGRMLANIDIMETV